MILRKMATQYEIGITSKLR